MAKTKGMRAAGSRNVTPALLAAGAAAALAAAAGYYLYGSKNAKQNRRMVAARAKDIRDGVVAQAKKVQKLDKKQVMAAIDAVAAGYERVRGVDLADVRAAAKELRGNWQKIASDIGREVRRSGSTVRKAGKRKTR
jgi:hypothetical protein